MKKVKCGYKGCSNRRIHWEEPDTMRPHQTVEVADDFDETVEKSFCSWECAIYAGYMTLNKKIFEEKGGIEYGGMWWVKDPSGGRNPRFAELHKKKE